MKVLITGAEGFIGSHLTERLVREGHEVKAFVLYNSFNSWGWLDHCAEEVRQEFEVFSGDIRDPNGVRSAICDCEAVLHLAALIGIPYSYHSPAGYRSKAANQAVYFVVRLIILLYLNKKEISYLMYWKEFSQCC